MVLDAPFVDLTWLTISATQAVTLLWTFFLAFLTPMLSLFSYFIDCLLCWSPIAIGIFGCTLCAWEGLISLVQVLRQPSPDAVPRRERRRLTKLV